jgi:hypothetical protein
MAEENSGILGKTLGEVLQNNVKAQGMVTSAMQISPAQFQELLKLAGNNQLMNMTIGDLFKNGVVQQAISQNVSKTVIQGQEVNGGVESRNVNQSAQGIAIGSSQMQQISPEQFGEIARVLQNSQSLARAGENDNVLEQGSAKIVPKPSFFQKIKELFKF